MRSRRCMARGVWTVASGSEGHVPVAEVLEHPRTRSEVWEDGMVYVHPTRKAATDVDLADRGLLLVPAAFTWPSVWPRTDPPWDPALVYSPPGTADLWQPDAPRAEALQALLGERRARVLLELDCPACTLEPRGGWR